MKKQEKGTIETSKVVYLHRRLSDGEVFYVGIGNKKRPYSKKGRNDFWWNYTNKHEYEVKILFEKLSWEEVCAKEKSLILEYGRRDLGLGTLVNLTDGGDGAEGRRDTEERVEEKRLFMLANNPMKDPKLRKKVSESKKGKARPDMLGESNPNFKPGVNDKKVKSWRKWFESEQASAYKETIKERYTQTLGSPEVKRKRAEVWREKVYKMTQEERDNMTTKMNAKSAACEYCGKVTNKGNYTRWHGEKCKTKKQINKL